MVFIWLRYECLKSDKVCRTFSKMRKEWLINVSEEPDMINIAFDNGKSSRQLIIGVSLFLAFRAIRKS